MREEFGGEWIHVYVWLNSFGIHTWNYHNIVNRLCSNRNCNNIVSCCTPVENKIIKKRVQHLDILWHSHSTKYYRIVKTNESQPLLSTWWIAEKYCIIPNPNPIQNDIISYEVLNAKCKLLLNDMYIHVCLVIQLSPTLPDPMDCSPAGSSVHGIFQAKIL